MATEAGRAIPPLPPVAVFVRDGCHLCEQLLAELETFRAGRSPDAAFTVSVHDIEDREDWLAHYTAHVPVVVVNDEEVCHYFLDTDALEEALSCP